ncbi:MAG: DUF177 domain-containing protein [Proteobacteria bacterium]|nr:DUF177 domain-containing protein [Pseudomonadota bacterium]
MKISVDRLTATPQEQDFEASAAWLKEWSLAQREPERTVLEPFRFALRAHTMGEDLLLEGEMTSALEAECSRCLARYRHALRDAFTLVLEPAGDRVPADPEGASALAERGVCLGDDLETGLYRGPELDLSAFFAEVAALALPVQPLCREDCAGLCPRCGVDRNQGDCGCVEEERVSPFAVLEALRGGSKPESGAAPEKEPKTGGKN